MIGVVGLGTMGAQIATVFARAGLHVVACDPDADAGLQRVRRALARAEDAEPVLARIETGALEALAAAEFVVEAVFEDAAVKKDVFGRLDAICGAATILATNTSTLSVSDLAAATSRPDRVIGTHFLIPASRTPLVEVVRGRDTSDDTHRRTLALLATCGKETVTVADSPGFVINRLYLPLVNEAFFALGNNLAAAEDIDRSCTRGLAFPLGPLAAADAFGLDILLDCMRTLERELGPKYAPAPLLVSLVAAGHLGRKTGRGVYTYT